MEKAKIKSVLESILFVSGEPLTITKLAKISECEKKKIKEAICELKEDYQRRKAGCVIIEKDDEVQMITNPENAKYVDNIIKSELQNNLSKSALEVLSIIAYRGPISRIDIEAIRGVNSSFLVRNLLLRGLIQKEENPNDSRSYLYKISFDFLKQLGIEKIEDLPNYEKLSKDERLRKVTEEKKDEN